MAKRTEQVLTKSAQAVAEYLKSNSDLTMKDIMSAGIIAFSELDTESKAKCLGKCLMDKVDLLESLSANRAVLKEMVHSEVITSLPQILAAQSVVKAGIRVQSESPPHRKHRRDAKSG